MVEKNIYERLVGVEVAQMQEDFDALHAEFASLSVQHGERISELERQIAEESNHFLRSSKMFPNHFSYACVGRIVTIVTLFCRDHIGAVKAGSIEFSTAGSMR